eukprot:CAMPEP_0183306118 /NCGR_PEP_ID=MMETSP0160_2-20130417/10643_1 /TAXON_ID=2839 ORGANISM="Odontella Sinensis, Strain Grunow 1884" /NCGR_SAMPLE_ID=MMETSP0160_2 /ASSEMBLY_ACC=CAM_ASM_000250 /LENGTH=101 /DNA_ID=CAMNT_0025469437 /DNA_START=106 /DNA_END=414 /DNA_ORIENTATION=+
MTKQTLISNWSTARGANPRSCTCARGQRGRDGDEDTDEDKDHEVHASGVLNGETNERRSAVQQREPNDHNMSLYEVGGHGGAENTAERRKRTHLRQRKQAK